MQALRLLYQNQLTEKPRKSGPQQQDGYGTDFGWVFVSNDCVSTSSCRTYHTLTIFSKSYTYYTPNTFYRRDKRDTAALRWLNALVIDIDVKPAGNGTANVGIGLPDVLDRVQASGLPMPTFIVRTPSGGYHVTYAFKEPRKAYSNVVTQYKKLQRAMVAALGGDPKAVGPERFVRMPTQENMVHWTGERTAFDCLTEWYWMNAHEEVPGGSQRAVIGHGDLLSHPAVQRLLEGAERGRRDHTCYTLALAYKASGYDVSEAEGLLLEWNQRLTEPLRLSEVLRKVRSAYKDAAPAGPSAEWIRVLSGLEFTYQKWEGSRPREERKTSHYEEWARDILDTICSHPEKELTGAQRELALWLGMPYSSFKEAIKLLVSRGQITVEVTGKGRLAKTTIRLVPDPTDPTKVVYLKPARRLPKTLKINEPDSYTLLAGVVGGSSFLHREHSPGRADPGGDG